MKSTYKRIGNYIELVDERNSGLKVKQLLGLSISKQFIPSVANIIGTDMENYKIISKNQFACSTMQVRRDKKMPVALLQEVDKAIISQAYPVFKVKDETQLLPEYLMMWFTRSEFDREACFYAVGGVRGSLEWEDFCDMKLPVPHIDKQQQIVAEYNTIVNRINLNKQLIQKLEETAQTIYKQWFVDFDFPGENGQPYKTSGGEMVESELGDIPREWEVRKFGNIATIKAGGDKPKDFTSFSTNQCPIPVYSNSSANEGLLGYTSKPTIMDNCITVSARGAIIGYTVLRKKPFMPVIRLIIIIPKVESHLNYIYECIRRLKFDQSGSAQGQLTVPDVSSYKILMPDSVTLNKYQKIAAAQTDCIDLKNRETEKLTELQALLLSKLATVENDVNGQV
ncbi:hypothetical protein GCM10028803_46290 [Larkinella knui]|uniref:Restriction endonuclease subunit S n=1 Tax=Larkinella knui TaxID=2025310 RepID=A0A3P1CPP0_9BACT|nr:restriction endonuclease subunit S [Larkinella knui]RRB15225.1 restriction endonuclease subunit S [Larkinella knui]